MGKSSSSSRTRKVTEAVSPLLDQLLFSIARGGDDIPEDAGTLAKKAVYNKFFALVNSLVLGGNAILFLVAYLSKFPLTPAEAAAAYPGIMDLPAFVPAILLTLFYFLAMCDMVWAILVLCNYLNPDDRQKVLMLRHSNITSLRFFLAQACMMIGNSLLWFDFSPWYYFGMNIGAVSFIILIVNGHSILYVIKGLAAMCRGPQAREANETEYCDYLEDIRGNDFRESFMWQAPLDFIKSYLLVQVFAGLFASAAFENTDLGVISRNNLYIVLMTVIVLLGSMIFELYLQRRALYLFSLAFQFMFLAIQQAGVNGGDNILDLWATSTACACFFFVCGVFTMFGSLMHHARTVVTKNGTRNEHSALESGLADMICGIRSNNKKEYNA